MKTNIYVKDERSISEKNRVTTQVRLLLAKMDRNRAAGPDGIVINTLSVFENFGIDHIIEILKEIYDSGEIPEGLIRSVFIIMPKKPRVNE